jgi:FkbM family methyltransferase
MTLSLVCQATKAQLIVIIDDGCAVSGRYDDDGGLMVEQVALDTVLANHTPKLPWLAEFLRLYMRSRLRGQTRATFFLARHIKSLQAVPIAFRDRAPVFVDLRLEGSHEWLEGSPWLSAPIEKNEQRVLSQITRPGDVVFDIGANIGLHTALFSRLVGRSGLVCSFEPNPQLANCLQQTVGGLVNARFYQVALSDEDSEVVLYVPVDHTMASLVDWTPEILHRRTLQVPCRQTTLDDLRRRDDLGQPDVVKCDVEGAELRVFRGAYRTLNRVDAPLILFEANVHNARHFNASVVAAKNYLASLPLPQFEFFEVSAAGGLQPAHRTEFEHANILAVPESRKHRLSDVHAANASAGDLRTGMVHRVTTSAPAM